MGTKSTKNTLLFLTILLCLVVVGLGAYTIKFYGEVKKNEIQLKEEKALISGELEDEIKRYNTILAEKSILTNELSQAKTRIENLQKNLDSNKISRNAIQRYRVELNKVRKERERLFKQNDSLQKETERLAQLQAETQEALDKEKKEKELLQDDNQALAQKLNLGAQITGSNLLARGVIQRNSGKFLNTARANRAKMIRVCYTINENKLAEAGDLYLFVQVLNSKGNMIGISREETFPSGEKLKFNSRTTIPYTNKNFNVCELVLPVQEFEKGDYTVNIFHEDRLLLTSVLQLK